MRKNKQLIVDKNIGDCFRACVTSLLDIPNGDYLPHAGEKDWFLRYYKFLDQFGLTFRFEQEACWQQGYWIASVPSKNYPEVTHAIVMKNYFVYHDPTTTKNKYPSGWSLLGSNIVHGGYIFTVTDFTKLHKLKEFKDNLNEKKKRQNSTAK